ncbi:MBL fold metallo-hydrolase [candidate division KSB3 bacterium]|uniref:MBL fold metallo-hydrolase n=1 Tax=candidate division KSB3 bacterium TaxID=2044937 RepID=A0A9D5JUE0_9BACT|nr:MBL fold metallo-hydrolase [candidate division KSB3 bacterium]MBD3324335.1 MBL fold metallo-hydrolase [candidate division KSB3 bacterium]
MRELLPNVFTIADQGAYAYLLGEGDDVIAIDAGFTQTPDEQMFPGLERRQQRISQVLLTHGHADHYEGAQAIQARFDAPVAIHTLDAPLMRFAADGELRRKLSLAYPDLFAPPPPSPKAIDADQLLEDGDTIQAGNCRLRVVHTPGHSEGSVCFYEEHQRLLFTGDAVSGGFLHFYCDPEVVERSLERLRRLDVEHLFMAHEYPPLNQHVLTGSAIDEFFASSLNALRTSRTYRLDTLRDIYRHVLDTLRETGREMLPQELVPDLDHTTLIALLKLLERAARRGVGTPAFSG